MSLKLNFSERYFLLGASRKAANATRYLDLSGTRMISLSLPGLLLACGIFRFGEVSHYRLLEDNDSYLEMLF